MSAKDLQNHLLKEVEGLDTISQSSVRQLMVPTNRRCKSATRYTSDVNARVPKKSNCGRLNNENAQYYSARVKYALEFGAKFKESCVADNMNKVKVGVLAVSRYHQINKYYSVQDVPDYPDHDFPNPGYLITPSGYLVLETADGDPFIKDELSRKHYRLARTGPLHIINRVERFQPCNIQAHSNDLRKILTDSGKSVAVLITDSGPDFDTNSLAVCLYYMRLWRDLDMDALFTLPYCPGFSAYNMVEHAWAPMSKKLTSVILPATLPGENMHASMQTALVSGREEKERSPGF